MPTHNLGVVETTAMLVIYTSAKVFLAFPRILVEYAGPAAWMMLLVSAAVALLTLFSLQGLAARFPGKSLVQATELSLGPAVGTFVNLIYAGQFFFLAFISVRQFAENIATTVLPETPMPVLVVAFLGVAVYAVILGVEGITRVSWVVAPFCTLTFLFLMAGGYWTFHVQNALTPFWGYGLPATVGGGLLYSSLYGELLVLGLLSDHFRKSQQLRKVGWWSFGLTTLVLVVVAITLLYVFPFPSGARVAFPLLEMSRLIITGRWVQRLESLFFLMWVIVATISVAVSLYATARTLADTIHLTNYRHLVLPLALSAYSMAQLPPNLVTAVSWDFQGLRVWGAAIYVLLPAVTLLAGSVRRMENRRAL